jgi:hypothetical protein
MEPLAIELSVLCSEWAVTLQHGLFTKEELAGLMRPHIHAKLQLFLANLELSQSMAKLDDVNRRLRS